jgi:hypothetical protein
MQFSAAEESWYVHVEARILVRFLRTDAFPILVDNRHQRVAHGRETFMQLITQ